MILGQGGPGIALPSTERADQAPRMPVRVHKIEDDVLFDCDLTRSARRARQRKQVDVTDAHR